MNKKLSSSFMLTVVFLFISAVMLMGAVSSTTFQAGGITITDSAVTGVSTLAHSGKISAASGGSHYFYKTFDQTTNYEDAYFKWDSNIFKIGIEFAGSGTSLRTGQFIGTWAVDTQLQANNSTAIASTAYVDVAAAAAADAVPAFVASSGAIAQLTKNNTYVVCTDTCTVTLKAPAAGVQACIRNAPGSARIITLAALGSGNYYELTDHSAYAAVNQKLVSVGLSNDQICVVGLDANHYLVMNSTSVWTDTP